MSELLGLEAHQHKSYMCLLTIHCHLKLPRSEDISKDLFCYLSFEQTNNHINITALPYDSNLYFLHYVTHSPFCA